MRWQTSLHEDNLSFCKFYPGLQGWQNLIFRFLRVFLCAWEMIYSYYSCQELLGVLALLAVAETFLSFFFSFVISLLWNKTGTLSCSNGSYRCQVVEHRLILYSGLWWSLSIRLSLKCLWWLKGHFSLGFFVVKSSYLGYLSTKKAR